MRLALIAVLLLSRAPFQCASDPDPNRRIEDTPAEALYRLSEHFQEVGDNEAREETLRHLIERYPSSREASRATLALEGRDTSDLPPSEGSRERAAERAEETSDD